MRMAGWLMYRGHKLLRIEDNRLQPGYQMFIFGDSDRLRNDMSEYVPDKGAEGIRRPQRG
ncbi:hypothetical protein [Paenibacillus soyae]|uniref:hypothetical protein n=1 Tax=Paenibacillus soyae TaxID=2969249 RepID=UPI0035301FFD